MARLEHHFGRHRDGGGDFGALEDARPRLAHLGQEARFPPPATSLVVLGPREVQAQPRSRHRDVEQPPLLGQYILAPPHQRLEHRRRQLEPRRAPVLRQTPLDQRRHEDDVELQAFRLVNRHHLDGVDGVDRRRLLVLARQQDQLEVAEVRVERVVGRRLAEFTDDLAQADHVGSRGISRLLHELVEEIAHVEALRGRCKTFNQRRKANHLRPRFSARQRNLVRRVAQDPQSCDEVPHLWPVVETMPADDHVRDAQSDQGARHGLGNRVGAAEHGDGRRRRARPDQPPDLACDGGRLGPSVFALEDEQRPARRI